MVPFSELLLLRVFQGGFLNISIHSSLSIRSRVMLLCFLHRAQIPEGVRLPLHAQPQRYVLSLDGHSFWGRSQSPKDWGCTRSEHWCLGSPSWDVASTTQARVGGVKVGVAAGLTGAN